MRRAWTVAVLGCLVAADVVVATARGDGGDAPKAPAAQPSTPSLGERANAAIDRGVAWLRQRQRADGSWGDMSEGRGRAYNGGEDTYDFPAGPTAFALYTLLKCGVAPDDPGIVKGFEALRKSLLGERSSYEIGVAILAIEAKYDQVKRERKREAAAELRTEPGKRPDLRIKLSRDDAAWMTKLMAALEDRSPTEGGWRYFRPTGAAAAGARQDTSSTAVAMLAILAAHRCGVEMPRKTVTAAVKWTLAQQDDDGPLAKDRLPKGAPPWTPPDGAKARGWPYVRKSAVAGESTKTTGNMTAAGLITLLAAQRVLADTGPETLKSLQPAIDAAVRDGMAWLGVHWSVTANPGDVYYLYMYLYGLERVGDLRRVATIAGHDWYTEGAQVLLSGQRDDGAWTRSDTHQPQDVLNTCFALLFLDRASLEVTTGK